MDKGVVKSIFIFDENKCVGCHACIVGCMVENGNQKQGTWRTVKSSNLHHRCELPLVNLSMSCNHCDDVPCMKNCPALAYSKNPETGAILHDSEKCLGCRYCTWTCPYDAPVYNQESKLIEKCHFCDHRIGLNNYPACSLACPTGALGYKTEEFSKADSFESSPIPANVGSHLKIEKLRNSDPPEMDTELFSESALIEQDTNRVQKISAWLEYPLLIFSLIQAGAVGIVLSGYTELFSTTQKIVFLIVVLIAGVVSLLHLGRKARAWRSVFNILNSWLSREILLYLIFCTCVVSTFFFIKIPLWLTSTIGITLLFSIDMLYQPAQWKWKTKMHSALSVLIALHLLFLLKSWLLLFSIMAAIRIGLYFFRGHHWTIQTVMQTVVRILLPGIAAVSILLTGEMITAILAFALGEIIDRIEFYHELRTPEWEVSYNQK